MKQLWKRRAVVAAVLVLVGTLLSDIALAWLDPRIRFAERG